MAAQGEILGRQHGQRLIDHRKRPRRIDCGQSMRRLHERPGNEPTRAPALVERDALLERRQGLDAATLIGKEGCGNGLSACLEEGIAGACP